jgi:streptogramin lyase
MNRLITILYLLISVSVAAQTISIGEWRDELPYREATFLGVSDDMVYTVTPYSLFTLRKSDNTMNRYSKINGLNDFRISNIEYSAEANVFFIAYSNANIDLIKDGEIINISDIKRKQILGKKTINKIHFEGNIAYLSCGFGIVLVDVNKEEIKDTWYIGENGASIEVFDIALTDQHIYAATERGLRRAELNSPNLADFQNWSIVADIPNSSGSFTQVESHNGIILAGYHPTSNQDIVYYQNGDSWSTLALSENSKVVNMCSGENKFYIMKPYSMDLFMDDLSFDIKVYEYNFDKHMAPSDVAEDADGVFWVADKNHGLLRTYNFYQFEQFQLNGPRTANVFDMDIIGGRVVVAPGGRNDSYGNLYKKDGVFTKFEETWINYTTTNTPALDTIYDPVSVSINPLNSNQYAVGSWGKGLMLFNENGLEQAYGLENSSLTPANGTSITIRVGGVAYDNSGNLWATASASNSLIHKMDPSGNWTAYELGSTSVADVGKMIIDSRNYKWIQLRQGGTWFVFVFDETQPAGSQLKGLNGNKYQGLIPGNTVSAMAEDLDGEMWLGTDEGIAVIYNPYNIFNDGDYDAQQIIVEKDGYAQYLLGSEKVHAIAVDGGNQKWVGTERAGLFLLSADGSEEIYHFTTENSPLYSDNILSIEIQDNGEVYVGTDKGIIVFRGEATQPNPTLNNVYAYPNPVRPEYQGAIAITGLVRDANVRITDVSGSMVMQTKAYGGQAIWDGKDLDGQRVETGVYLVFISDDEGSETAVTKILFVK